MTNKRDDPSLRKKFNTGENSAENYPLAHSKSAARKRWKLLAKALLKNDVEDAVDVSVRRFNTFEILLPNRVTDSWTEYWKSNARKYCEFCKCWIADNKISVSLHEDGKRHKDNVAKKISVITKKSAKDHKAQVRLDAEMAKMEKVAMAAYLNDIKNNADLTSQLINHKLAGVNRVDVVKKDVKVDISGNSSHAYGYGELKRTAWQEAKAEGGHSYYWNTETNEASWEVPKEGFTPLSELAVKIPTPNSKPKNIPKPPKKGKKIKGQKNPNQNIATLKKEPPPTYYGPQPSNPNPYGKWTTVKTISADDLQLPEQKFVPVVAPTIALPVEKVFKEKEMKPLEDDYSADSGFKKRKINCNAKRNTRQRVDDD